MSHRPPHLNSHRRRARKDRLAARDGRQCYYCRRPFRELREATFDHIVPVSLWRTWSVSALVLACRSCNTVKADRLSLLLSLVLCAAFPSTPVNDVSTGVDAPLTPVDSRRDAVDAHSMPVNSSVATVDVGSTPVDSGSTPVDPTVHVNTPTVHVNTSVFTGPFTLAVWRLLARLAADNLKAFTSVTTRVTPGVTPQSADGQSTPDQPESTCHGRHARRPSTRPDCLRAPRSVRACSGPTGEAVPA